MYDDQILDKIEEYLWNTMKRSQKLVKNEEGKWMSLVDILVYWEDYDYGAIGIELIYEPALEMEVNLDD